MTPQHPVPGFPVTDPRGMVVHCSSENWAAHAAKHTEVAGHPEWVAAAISRPVAIYRSNSHVDRAVYYHRLDVDPSVRLRYLRVVVAEHARLREGWFVSAFAVRGPKKTEVPLWP